MYSVSYAMSDTDSGVCVTYWTLREAEACFRDGVQCAILWGHSGTVLKRYRRKRPA